MRVITDCCSPSEFSSISVRLGFTMRARAIISIFCSPPDNVPAFCVSRCSKKGNIVNTRPTQSRTLRRYNPSGGFSARVPPGRRFGFHQLNGILPGAPHPPLSRFAASCRSISSKQSATSRQRQHRLESNIHGSRSYAKHRPWQRPGPSKDTAIRPLLTNFGLGCDRFF